MFVSVLGLLGVVAVVITLLQSLKHEIKASIGEICFDERWMGCFVAKTPRFLLGRNEVQLPTLPTIEGLVRAGDELSIHLRCLTTLLLIVQEYAGWTSVLNSSRR